MSAALLPAVNRGHPGWAWPAALAGLALAVFGVVALTGPGRIDIVDGQTRYEEGRSLVDHGDLAIRDPEVKFAVFPGRDGYLHSYYRFPQVVMAAACIELADATGPTAEARRQFFFSLHGAVLAAAVAVVYARWFRRRGHGPAGAIGWAAAGVLCTPTWYYATSCFDDIVGTWAVVAALAAADRRTAGWAAVGGLLIGVALNCKPPLAAFVLPVLALADDRSAPRSARLTRAGLILAAVAAGLVVYRAYEAHKFPGDTKASHPALLDKYAPMFFGNPVEAVLDLAAGPASGTIWYAPAALLGLFGALRRGAEGEGRPAAALGLAALGFLGFISLMTFYKGDTAWGPRYLTPVYAAFWLYAPDGARLFGRRRTNWLLAAGAVVQVLGLATDPQRLYMERQAPTGFYQIDPWLHFRWELSHLLNRPREAFDAATAPPAPEFNASPVPTFAVMAEAPKEPDELPRYMHRYQIFHGLRFWWASFPHLPPDRRPVDLAQAGAVFGGALAAGLALLAAGLAGGRRSPPPS